MESPPPQKSGGHLHKEGRINFEELPPDEGYSSPRDHGRGLSDHMSYVNAPISYTSSGELDYKPSGQDILEEPLRDLLRLHVGNASTPDEVAYYVAAFQQDTAVYMAMMALKQFYLEMLNYDFTSEFNPKHFAEHMDANLTVINERIQVYKNFLITPDGSVLASFMAPMLHSLINCSIELGKISKLYHQARPASNKNVAERLIKHYNYYEIEPLMKTQMERRKRLAIVNKILGVLYNASTTVRSDRPHEPNYFKVLYSTQRTLEKQAATRPDYDNALRVFNAHMESVYKNCAIIFDDASRAGVKDSDRNLFEKVASYLKAGDLRQLAALDMGKIRQNGKVALHRRIQYFDDKGNELAADMHNAYAKLDDDLMFKNVLARSEGNEPSKIKETMRIYRIGKVLDGIVKPSDDLTIELADQFRLYISQQEQLRGDDSPTATAERADLDAKIKELSQQLANSEESARLLRECKEKEKHGTASPAELEAATRLANERNERIMQLEAQLTQLQNEHERQNDVVKALEDETRRKSVQQQVVAESVCDQWREQLDVIQRSIDAMFKSINQKVGMIDQRMTDGRPIDNQIIRKKYDERYPDYKSRAGEYIATWRSRKGNVGAFVKRRGQPCGPSNGPLHDDIENLDKHTKELLSQLIDLYEDVIGIGRVYVKIKPEMDSHGRITHGMLQKLAVPEPGPPDGMGKIRVYKKDGTPTQSYPVETGKIITADKNNEYVFGEIVGMIDNQGQTEDTNYNLVFMAYGQSGTGKSRLMIGSVKDHEKGLLGLILDRLSGEAGADAVDLVNTLRISVTQVYGDKNNLVNDVYSIYSKGGEGPVVPKIIDRDTKFSDVSGIGRGGEMKNINAWVTTLASLRTGGRPTSSSLLDVSDNSLGLPISSFYAVVENYNEELKSIPYKGIEPSDDRLTQIDNYVTARRFTRNTMLNPSGSSRSHVLITLTRPSGLEIIIVDLCGNEKADLKGVGYDKTPVFREANVINNDLNELSTMLGQYQRGTLRPFTRETNMLVKQLRVSLQSAQKDASSKFVLFLTAYGSYEPPKKGDGIEYDIDELRFKTTNKTLKFMQQLTTGKKRRDETPERRGLPPEFTGVSAIGEVEPVASAPNSIPREATRASRAVSRVDSGRGSPRSSGSPRGSPAGSPRSSGSPRGSPRERKTIFSGEPKERVAPKIDWEDQPLSVTPPPRAASPMRSRSATPPRAASPMRSRSASPMRQPPIDEDSGHESDASVPGGYTQKFTRLASPPMRDALMV